MRLRHSRGLLYVKMPPQYKLQLKTSFYQQPGRTDCSMLSAVQRSFHCVILTACKSYNKLQYMYIYIYLQLHLIIPFHQQL